MPVPTNPEMVIAMPHVKTVSQPSQKLMTKAERRELQEKQRAAKLLQKQNAAAAAPAAGGSAATPKPKQPSTPSQRRFPGDGGVGGTASRFSAQKDTTPSAAIGVDDGTGGMSRGLRIFSHFGLPKPVGHSVKGDIHPAIVRLGLLFSEFRICGSNARCIATLLAFKKVCCLAYARWLDILTANLGDTRLYHP